MIGSTISHYEVVEKLGEGGMGVVYKARDSRLKRLVALKVLPPEKVADPERKRRFVEEAQAASALNHPNIVTVHDIGQSDGVDFIAMEYVEGHTLGELIGRRGLKLHEALRIATQIADALAKAHAAGIVHRDLKPGNVMVTPEGRVKVLDFGLAKLTETALVSSEDPTLTAAQSTEYGMIMGTAAYMSPEQAEGKKVDARSDIFSFGSVLYEMLIGRGAFRRDNPALTLAAVLHLEPPPLPAEIPRELERVVARCLRKDPARRVQTMADLKVTLEDQMAAAVRPGPQRARPLWRALDRIAIIVLTAAVLASVAAGYFFLHRAPKLTDKDMIVLADFDNKTGDPVFDDTLRQGLAVQLKQSPFLSLISDQKIRQTLQLMGKPPDQKLTAELTREVCERTGSAAMLTGSIASLGTRYVLGLRAVSCSTGDTLDEQQVQSEKKEDVLDAVSGMASKFRARAGESLADIQRNNVPLREATTSSLEALKAYTNALKGVGSGYETRSLPLLKRATEIDPRFALAWADLALGYSDLGEQELARESTANAYKWRDHTSGPEKFHIAYVYDRNVTGNLEKAWQTVSLWRQTYPRDAVALDLSAGYAANGTGRYDEAIKFAEMALALDPAQPTALESLVGANFYLDRFDEASKAIQRY